MSVTWKSGVYLWLNLRNGKVYVGSAARGLDIRRREHLRDLSGGKCHNRILQHAWNKYGGLNGFKFCVLERCSPSDCLSKETYWIEKLNACDRRFGYNLCKQGNSALGVKRSAEWKEKRKLLPLSQKQKQALVESNRSRTWKAESIQKKSVAQSRLWEDPLYREVQVSKRTGKKASEETRARMSAAQKCRWAGISKDERRKLTKAALQARKLVAAIEGDG